MALLTITAANSVYMLTVPGLFNVPQQIQGFAADAAFETDASEAVEVMKGVDGRTSAGFTPYLTRQTINLQADSPSSIIFETWLNAMQAAQEVYAANAQITLPSIGRKYTLTQGYLSSAPPIVGTRRVLQPRAFIITWSQITPANV